MNITNVSLEVTSLIDQEDDATLCRLNRDPDYYRLMKPGEFTENLRGGVFNITGVTSYMYRRNKVAVVRTELQGVNCQVIDAIYRPGHEPEEPPYYALIIQALNESDIKIIKGEDIEDITTVQASLHKLREIARIALWDIYNENQ